MTNEVTEGLAAHQEQFLSFLRARLGSRELAEDVLQAAYLKASESAGSLRAEESSTAWFYRLLRNSIVDLQRRRGSEARALQAEEQDALAQEPDDPELRSAVCGCIRDALGSVKPEYAELLRRVDLDEIPVPQAAREAGITPNNAAVRLHRARSALRDELRTRCGTCASHGCLDCGCRRRK